MSSRFPPGSSGGRITGIFPEVSGGAFSISGSTFAGGWITPPDCAGCLLRSPDDFGSTGAGLLLFASGDSAAYDRAPENIVAQIRHDPTTIHDGAFHMARSILTFIHQKRERHHGRSRLYQIVGGNCFSCIKLFTNTIMCNTQCDNPSSQVRSGSVACARRNTRKKLARQPGANSTRCWLPFRHSVERRLIAINQCVRTGYNHMSSTRLDPSAFIDFFVRDLAPALEVG